MILLLVTVTIAVVGLVAIALAEPHRTQYPTVWSDDAERRLLRNGGAAQRGWW